MTNIQSLIKELRDNGVTREELAYKMGISYSTVIRWEQGKTEPRASEYRELQTFREKYASNDQIEGSSERT